jgi:hypothetical protein
VLEETVLTSPHSDWLLYDVMEPFLVNGAFCCESLKNESFLVVTIAILCSELDAVISVLELLHVPFSTPFAEKSRKQGCVVFSVAEGLELRMCSFMETAKKQDFI